MGLTTEEEINKVNDKLEDIGIHRPLKDELELKDYMPQDKELPGDPTSEEESELPGTKRPTRGSGW